MSVLKRQCVEKSISGLHTWDIYYVRTYFGRRAQAHTLCQKRLVCQAAELYNHKINLICGIRAFWWLKNMQNIWYNKYIHSEKCTLFSSIFNILPCRECRNKYFVFSKLVYVQISYGLYELCGEVLVLIIFIFKIISFNYYKRYFSYTLNMWDLYQKVYLKLLLILLRKS